jgi:hypothetical protein
VTCVLRISAPAIEAAVRGLSLQPYRLEDATAHFLVSEAGFDELAAQVEDAIAFLKRCKEDVAKLMDLPSAEGWLDFGIADRHRPAQSNHFPPELVCLAGKAGIGLEMSTYRVEEPGSTLE